MAKYLGAKCRLCRAAGEKLFLKGERCYSPKCPLERKGAVPPGQHGFKGKKVLSEYGHQLKEKQKIKRIYGVSETQLHNYFKKAFKVKGEATGEVLLQLLESRLDNVIYRLGFVPSRTVARHLVSQGHVLVNNQLVNIPSYQVKPGELISLKPKALKMEIVSKSLAEKERKIPSWLQRQGAVGKIIHLPKREELDINVDESLIIEFYSR